MPEDGGELMRALHEMSVGQNDNTEAMLALILEAERKEPKDHMVHVLKGWVYTLQGKYSRAKQSFDLALNLNPGSAWAHFRKGEVYQLEGEHVPALGCFIRAVKLKPKRADFWLAKATEEAELGLLDKAEHSYGRAIELNDPSGWSSYGKAMILFSRGLKAEAKESLRKAIADNPAEESFKTFERVIGEAT
jgi:tetratricopeptide (TPR) repeat protein